MEYLSLVLGPILFEIYVNDMSNNLTIDHLLYAVDVKLIAPKNNQMPSKAPCLLAPNGQRVGS